MCKKIHIVSEIVNSPITNCMLCIGFQDTCIYSDDSGNIAIEFLIADSALFTLSAAGFKDTVLAYDAVLSDSTSVVMKSFESTQKPLEIVVTAPAANHTYRQSTVSFTPDDLKTKAGTVEDIGRYIGTLPSAVSSLSAGYDNTFFIRGGRPSENIFLIDGIEMENINHFSQANGSGGPIGFVNTADVKEVQFYAGNIPVRYPSKMSSVTDISMKSGSLQEASRTAGGELTGGILSAEGPLIPGRSSYMVSGRYVDFTMLRGFVTDAGVPKLGDLYGKILALGTNDIAVSATGILSYNGYRYKYPILFTAENNSLFFNSLNENETIFQGGAGLSAHYEKGSVLHEAHLALSFRNGFQENRLSSFSDTFITRRYAGNPVNSWKDNRTRYLASTRTALLIKEYHTLSFGLRTEKNTYQLSGSDQSQYQGECIICDGNGNPDTITMLKKANTNSASFENTESGGFIDYEYDKGFLQSSAGLRADNFQLLDDFRVSPRLSLSLKPPESGVFTGSLGLYHQFPTDLPSLIFNYYYYVYPNISADSLKEAEQTLLRQGIPQRCWQASFGYNNSLLGKKMNIRAEVYYKWYDREYSLLMPDIPGIFLYNNNGKLVLREQNGKRRAYGAEASLNSLQSKGFFYSLGMSMFEVENRYNDGGWYDDWTDVGYTFSFSIGAQFLNGHMLSVSFQGSGGRPYCPQSVVLDCINRKYAAYTSGTSYYSGRLEKLVATNMRYSFTKKIHKIKFESFIEILNLIDYKPTLEYRFNGDHFLEIKPFGFTPIIGFKVEW